MAGVSQEKSLAIVRFGKSGNLIAAIETIKQLWLSRQIYWHLFVLPKQTVANSGLG